jgi:hypothetical protein
MANSTKNDWFAALVTAALATVAAFSLGAQELHLETKTSIASGLHLWYELKADPEDLNNLIVCGTKWDSIANSPYGFVESSRDSGMTWRTVLEDRSSVWVTEQSCAFGIQHKAYFVSEAAGQIDGVPSYELGRTRLFLSLDGGESWVETTQTGWADASTSAVSLVTDRLYTFFNDPSARDSARKRGNSVGLLVFSADGKHVTGPFFCPEMREMGYRGTYPDNAVALKSGGVAALYYGTRQTNAGRIGDLGIVRADRSTEPTLERAVISHAAMDKECWNFDRGTMTYDRERNRLFVIYLDGCKDTRIMVTSSDDEGRTWKPAVSVGERQNRSQRLLHPSVAVDPDGSIGLMWSEPSGKWFFTHIREGRLVTPFVELSSDPERREVTNDSLWTTVDPPLRRQDVTFDGPSEPTIAVGVRSLAKSIWRGSGLTTVGARILAIWPSMNIQGMRLNLAVLGGSSVFSKDENSNRFKGPAIEDVTERVRIAYEGRQEIDEATGTLTVCLALTNEGNSAIRTPVQLVLTEITSPGRSVSIMNATNGLNGAGAIWDISNSLTGDRIPPGTTSNAFCLSAHIGNPVSADLRPDTEDLVKLRIRVLAQNNDSSGPAKHQ